MKKLLALLAAAIGIAAGAYADTAKAVLLDGGETMRLVYDNKNYGSQNTDWFDVSDLGNNGRIAFNGAVRLGVRYVEIDPSFYRYKPTSCANWFLNYRNLRKVAGTCNLDVSQVTSFQAMFAHCYNLLRLDVSTWDTSKVTDMRSMFNGCLNLALILATDSFTTAKVTSEYGVDMFKDCNALVGGAGTAYNADRTGCGYATIDRVRENGGRKRGFFTEGGIPVAVLSFNGQGLRFYCDTEDHSSEGTVFPLYGWSSHTPTWVGFADLSNVGLVIFSDSFAKFRPASCREWLKGCNKLIYLRKLNNVNTEDCTSFEGMFYDCESLETIDLSSLNTSRARNMSWMFYGCRSLESLDLSSFDTSNVTDMHRMFSSCYALPTLDLSSFDTSNVTDMNSMFSFCSAMTSFDLSKLDTSKVTNMDGMFSSCHTLTSLDLSKLDTSNVKDMGRMFDGCIRLESLSFAGLDTSNVTDMSCMFNCCNSLSSLDLAGFSTSSVTDMSYMFNSCKALASLDLTGFDTSSVTTMEGMFENCHSMARLDLSSFDTSNVATMKGMFSSCTSLCALDVSSFDTSRVTTTDSMFRECRSLKSLDLGNFSLPSIARLDHMFRDCGNLVWVNLSGFNPVQSPEQFVYCEYMFAGCSRLKTIYVSPDYAINDNPLAEMIPAETYASWKKFLIGTWMFTNCKSIVGGNGTGYNYNKTWEEYARIDTSDKPGYFTVWSPPVAVYSADAKTLTFYFDGADHSAEGSVYSVDDAVARDPRNMDMPWYGDCHASVTNVVFDRSFAKYRPKHCGRWFKGFTALKGVTGIGNLVVSQANSLRSMFQDCPSLAMVDLTGFDTSMVKDMDYMFSGCSSLKILMASDTFTTRALTNASANMFKNCSSLRGGRGTAYASAHTDAEYARVDVQDAPGYFTTSFAVAVYSQTNRSLTFYCDGKNHYSEGTVYRLLDAEVASPLENPPWYVECHDAVRRVVFDDSFAEYRPQHCGCWFKDFSRLTQFVGIKNLDVSATKSLERMFYQCTALTELDLTGFDTRNVRSIKNMFYRCSNLEFIDVSGSFTTFALERPGDDVFVGCFNIRGRLGTAYDATHVDSTYARVDNIGAPGYFGKRQAIATYSASANTLQFFYDGMDHSAADAVFLVSDAEAIDPLTQNVPWFDACHSTVTRVVFDKSFANYRPAQCASWFYGFTSLTQIDGIENLDVSSATDMRFMFADCSSLASLDLSGLDTGKVKSMKDMFSGCVNLVKIYADDAFTKASLTNRTEALFGGNTRLVGGLGTGFDASHIDSAYARIDKKGSPGYFSERPTAVAVFTRDNATLTFYYDANNHNVEGNTIYRLDELEGLDGSEDMPWFDDCCSTVKRVVFDPSFANYRPRSCARWFRQFVFLEQVEGLYYLDVSRTVDMERMFDRCINLKELDLSEFDTHSVTNMTYMFGRCPRLTTIYASDAFVTTWLTHPDDVIFNEAGMLVGGAGTVYSASYRGASRARIDGGSGNEGYFTRKNPVAVLSLDGTTLTFYSDNKDHAADGLASYSVLEADSQGVMDDPPWSVCCGTVTRVVFDKSFKSYRPKHCAGWFKHFGSLETIVGIRNLDVARATSLRYMFYGCSSLETLGLEYFDTARVTDMYSMFENCTKLKAVFASDKFTTDALTSANESMFRYCSSLVGGEGTAYELGKDGHAFALIDSGWRQPGYFTYARAAVAVLANGSLKFYYDGQDHSSEGTVFRVRDGQIATANPINPMGWGSDVLGIFTIEFDASFADYRPRSCALWFMNCKNLVRVTGLEYLDVSEATSLYAMFAYCESLQTLDLSGFDTRSLKFGVTVWDLEDGTQENIPWGGCEETFAGCKSLKTIYASEKFDLSYLDPHRVFMGCQSLVGGNGSYFPLLEPTSRSANIDTIATPGYFTCLRPVAVYSDTAKTLTFYHDGRDHSEEGTVYSVAEMDEQNPFGTQIQAPWHVAGVYGNATKVVFDKSFAGYRPKHCAAWFSGFVELAEVVGLQHLDVSQATSLKEMFCNCAQLRSLDLCGFDTTYVRDMEGMFSGCSNLATIYTSAKFSTGRLANPGNVPMFESCSSLVGGNGTAYGNNTATYARIDRNSSPGYFTEKVARAIYSLETRTLTFRYDSEPFTDTETAWGYLLADADARDPSENPPWGDLSIWRVVFEPSFAAYRPKHCANWFKRKGKMTEVMGLKYLDVSEATSLHSMFESCGSLVTLDLSGFRTDKVRDMGDMFYSCTNLTTIYASDGFTTESLEVGSEARRMFGGCQSLVGGNGTSFAETGGRYSEYARIDTVTAQGYFTDNEKVSDWDGNLSTLTSDAMATDGLVVYGTLRGNYKVSIEAGATVTLRDATITCGENEEDYDWAGLTCLGKATIVLEGENTVKGFYEDYPGIHVRPGMTLTIKGEGSLTAMSNGYGAGIGGGYEIDCGKIVIEGGVITATGRGAAGIGSGYGAACGTITINGGVVNATGGNFAAGIGSGRSGSSSMPASCGRITITGGEVNATGGGYAAGIGAGRDGSCGTIEIGAGIVRVVATRGSNSQNPIGAGYNGVSGEVVKAANMSDETVGATRTIEPWNGDLATLDSDVDVTLEDGSVVHGTLGGIHRLIIPDGATVTISNVTVNGVNNDEYMWAGITCEGDATVILEGVNSVRGYYEDYPGIDVPAGKTLVIRGPGALAASSNGYGCGIGGGFELDCGNIVIEGGVIEATGGEYAAGIGSGSDGSCGNIAIEGGDVTATGGEGAPGIGAGFWGSCCDIVVSGGTVVATGDANAAGIGTGSGEECVCGDITIRGGTVAATGGETAAGIGTGNNAECGAIVIGPDISRVVATCGSGCDNPIGTGAYGRGGDVSVVGDVFDETDGATRTIWTRIIDLGTLTGDTTVTNGYILTGTLAGNYKVSIQDDATVTFRDMSIVNGRDTGTFYWAGVTCEGSATVVLEGESAVKAFNEYYPGLYVPPYETLTLRGDGKIMAIGGRFYGAGIGAGGRHSSMSCGNIVIESGDIVATSGGFAAGIGAGLDTGCGDITILGGNVVATGGGGSAGIGTGMGLEGMSYCGDITISGGTVVAYGGQTAAGIGSGVDGECGFVTIGEDIVRVTATCGEGCDNPIGAGGGEYSDCYGVTVSSKLVDTTSGSTRVIERGELSGYELWAAGQGLSGAEAAWDAKPSIWNGWSNGFIYTFGEGLADGTIHIMAIWFDADGNPVITTTPVVEGRTDFTPAVIGTTTLDDWTAPVFLDRDGNDWTLPPGASANFFRVRLTE